MSRRALTVIAFAARRPRPSGWGGSAAPLFSLPPCGGWLLSMQSQRTATSDGVPDLRACQHGDLIATYSIAEPARPRQPQLRQPRVIQRLGRGKAQKAED